jgi:glycosyltransferase involved in cell wall biosynthesis
MARLRGLIWPDDLPPPHGTARISSLPPLATLDFTTPPTAAMGETPDLPEGSVLYHGPGSPSALRLLLSAWSWVAGPMGEAYSLVALGLDKEGREGLSVLALEYGLGDTVRSLPPLSPSGLVAAYRGAAALLHPASEPPWGGPVRLALARGLPVVSFLDSRIEALVGPAAYLVKRDDARALGAALITVLVEGEISEQLAQGGLQRAAAWSPTAFAAGLEQAYSDTVFLKSPTPNPTPK